MLPIAVLDQIEKILRQFLWKGPELGRGGAKVVWEDVCFPKKEGGLGIRRLWDCNRAAMLKQIWLLFLDKEALWCKWIHSTFLKDKNFWVAKKPTICSWAWKKLLSLRSEIRNAFFWRIGDGRSVSLWFHKWHTRGALNLIFSDSLIYSSRLSRQWIFFFDDGHALSQDGPWVMGAPLPILSQEADCFCSRENPSGQFTVAATWEAIRRKQTIVYWRVFIWNNAITPKYQLNLWLIAKRRLPT